MTAIAPAATENPAIELAVLRLLLDDARVDPDDLDWSVVLPAAERQGLLLRLAAWFDRRREVAPPQVAAAIDRERNRMHCLIGLVGEIEARCNRAEVDHVFLTIVQQFPDVGRTVDILVSGTADNADRVLFHGGRNSAPATLRRRLANTTTYDMAECGVTLEVHHGRVGRLGEHERFARQLLNRRRRVCLGDLSWSAPSPEDAMLLQALNRLYGRPALRLRDAHWTITTIREGNLDWDYLLGAARVTGLTAGLSCYLEYAEQIHRQLLDRPLLSDEVRSRLATGDWGEVFFESGSYRFPAAKAGRLYLNEFISDLASGNWASASRLVLLPVVAAAEGYRHLSQPAISSA